MGGVFIVIIEWVVIFLWQFATLTENDDTDRPILRFKPTSANSCVPARKPLGYVGDYASAPICGLRLALHHFSIF
jgi:hypothetical protein